MPVAVFLSAADGIVGRDAVLRAFDELLAGVRAGRGGGIVVSGESGVGKTALLRAVVDRADGLRVLAATGLKSEATLPFATLGDLLRPLLPRLGELPPPQAAALSAALALTETTASLGRYAVCMGVLTLLSTAAESHPLLVVVDDAQWMDGESAAALLFAARRLENDAALIVLTVRDEPGGAFDPGGLAVLRLEGLDRQACRTLLASLSSEQVAPAVADQLHAATRGNPLAFREICSRLSPDELKARLAMPDPLPVGGEVRRMFAAQMASLPGATRLALLVVALSSAAAADRLSGSWRVLDLDESHLEPARTAGLIVSDGVQVVFAHPLIRSVVRADAGADARRRAYAALAETATDDEAVLYRAAGADGPDDALADDLAAAAGRIRDRLGFAEAARMLHRAAELTPDQPRRALRLLAGAQLALAAGRNEEASAWLEAARELTGDPAMIAGIELARGRALTMRGIPAIAREVLVGAADAVEHVDPRGAARLLCEAALPTFTDGRIDDGVAYCARAVALAQAAGAAEELAQSRLVQAQALALVGRTTEAAQAVTGLRAYVEGLDPVADGLVLSMVGEAQNWLEQPADARRTLDRVVDACRREGAPAPLAIALNHRAETERLAGVWKRARADGEEALRLAHELWQPLTIGFVQVVLARIDAAQGRAESARQRLAEAGRMSGPLGTTGLAFYARGVLGLLHLSEGRPDEAVACLEPGREYARRHGLRNPSVVFWEPDLVEAYWRSGQLDRAAELLASFVGNAEETGLATANAAVERCRGLLAGDADVAEVHFRRAAALHERCHRPFEQARTALCHGEVMRRHRRVAASRASLLAALQTFQLLGAVPFAARAAAELSAAGGSARVAAETSAVEQLSPQEFQVALAVARGLSNPAAAASLFLSRKTVEAHLSRVYRKLGISSRTQLVRFLTMNDVLAEAAGPS